MLHSEIFGEAVFVKASEECINPCFFGTFFAEESAKTKIVICGLGFFKLYINGVQASDDYLAPVTSFYHRQENCYCEVNFGEEMNSRIYAVKYDISHLVKDGENDISVSVGPGWYGEFSKDCVLCYKITSGRHTTYSDTNIKWSAGPLTYYNIHLGEKQDFAAKSFDLNCIPTADKKETVVASLPKTEYYIQDCPNDRIIRSVAPKKIASADGFDIYDAGENISGTYVFRCADAGKKISVVVSEALNGDDIDERRSHDQTAEFITDGSAREYRLLFTWHAFRYFKITSCADVLRVDVIHTDVEKTASFKSENPVLNWFFDAYIRTQLCNMHAGIPSDCPHIERRGYTGDGQLTCETVMLTTDAKKFYLKWMEDISDCQDKNSGHIQYTAPYFKCGGGPGGWGCAIAEVPYIYYKMFGDIEPMKKYFDQMLAYLGYLEAHSENDLVVSDQPGLWCLGEWCVPGDKRFVKPDVPPPFVNTYFYIRTIDRMTELAEKCGKSDCVPMLKSVRARKVNAIYQSYFDEKTGDFASNVNSANVFALDIGLGDARTFGNFLKKVHTLPLDTGIFGTDLTVKLLFERGCYDDAVEFLTREKFPSYGFMMNSGATTLWEEWQNPRSMSHPMFGAPVKYLFYNILGIRQKEGAVGFEKVIIEPKTNEMTGDISGYITTSRGKISVSVDRKKNVCRVGVPKETDAEIVFDGDIEIERT